MVSWVRPVFLFLTLFLSTLTQASVTNYTIDDSSPDLRTGNSILYSPSNAWNTATSCHGSSDPSKCSAQPNQSRVYHGTWHEGTFYPDRDGYPPLVATVRFDAVYVYCVLYRGLRDATTDMSFTIDGRLVGEFRQSPPAEGYVYDVLAFSTTSLSPGFHELEITNGTPGGPKSLIIFDRIVYSFDDGVTTPPPSTATPPPSNLGQSAGGDSSVPSSTISKTSDSQVAPTHSTLQPGLIIGIVLGSAAASLISVVIFLLFWRRQRRARNTVSAGVPAKDGNSVNTSSTSEVDPFLSGVHHSTSNDDRPRWFIASDSKRTLLETAAPPMCS